MINYSIVWDDRFKTGFQTIDDQHKKLFKLFNIFSSACAMGEDQSIVSEFLFELEDYTHYHFKEEEKLFNENNYAPTKKHLIQHADFITTLHDLKFEYVSDNKPISAELLEYIQNWLIDHTLGIDKVEISNLKN